MVHILGYGELKVGNWWRIFWLVCCRVTY